jgi:cytochrome c peroxidase
MRLVPFTLSALLVISLAGCQKAERYGPQILTEGPAKKAADGETPPKTDRQPLDPEIQWIDVDHPPKPDVVIDFVHAEKAPEVWNKLPKFWNAPPLAKPDEAAALIGMSPLTVGALAGRNASNVVQIKVPLGLPDPREYIPAGEDLTLGKWKLGQQLFFDPTYLEAKAGTSCATCHRPDHGFADHVGYHRDSFNVPTLVNCVFNRWQFWDGRVARLEEVIQRTLEDERESNERQPFRHIWSGVIGRLRKKANYHEQFNNVFGTPSSQEDGKEKANITQDTVGRAIACYLRTILSGDSIHDRALREQARKQSPALKAEHYEAVLDDAALAELGQEKAKKSEVAGELERGYRLFYGRDENRPLVNCYRCHSGRTFTDNEFHNLGVGHSSPAGQEGGRFAQVPIGQKNRYLIDAYKTPTLRNLLRTGPYFHNGSQTNLRDLVRVFYNRGVSSNVHLDPELRGPDGKTLELNLSDAEADAITLFLRALNGREVDAALLPPTKSSP